MKNIAFSIVVLVCAAAVQVSAQAPQLPKIQIPEKTPTPTRGSAVGGSERALTTAHGDTPTTWTPRKGTQTWAELIEDLLTPRKAEKSIIIRIDDKYAYPHPAVSVKMEIVREDEDFVWLRGIPPEDPESSLHTLWLQRQSGERLLKQRIEWEREHGEYDYWLDYGAEMVPPPFIDTLSSSRTTPNCRPPVCGR